MTTSTLAPVSGPWGTLGGEDSAHAALEVVELRLHALDLALQIGKLVHQLPLVGSQRLVDVSAELIDLLFSSHGSLHSSVVGAPEGSDSAGSLSGDPAESYGPQLATADDVIAGRARYADTPGGHADRQTMREEQA